MKTHCILAILYSENRGYRIFNGRVLPLPPHLDLNIGYYHIKLDTGAQQLLLSYGNAIVKVTGIQISHVIVHIEKSERNVVASKNAIA